MTQASRGRRRGVNFTVRITEEERARLEALQSAGGGPRSVGPWLLWKALGSAATAAREALPRAALPAPAELAKRTILDLCGGSGSWARPYVEAGYRVELVTLPERDVRTYVPPEGVWGVLAAPPCTQFSMARNGCTFVDAGGIKRVLERDFVEGMACVNACMRIILQCRPRWWALENPSGYLGHFLGRPRDTWEPCDFGDPWTKRTCLWGDFTIPARGPFVEPEGSAMDRAGSAARAVTPPGFARAFFEANP